ncbi:hypothetical protein GCM10007079_31520 [Nocardiopsis terrae]|uniref:Uncharacterized protein n=1 Tax=Nocardiopsis terrae TaxID=372655 RepID=A0ABR9HIX7_9ACTN|nr:hypothetical protein [Nocardiopsis terrae]MBE1458975.1 hypothetical protein [Nocardiopsis terrae]GHC87397.1 hypothetical protein GCM10007079_31520 [Nocardiopsis terrae]
MISFVLSALALTVVVGLILAIFVAGGVYANRVRNDGIDAVLAGARKHRELR